VSQTQFFIICEINWQTRIDGGQKKYGIASACCLEHSMRELNRLGWQIRDFGYRKRIYRRLRLCSRLIKAHQLIV